MNQRRLRHLVFYLINIIFLSSVLFALSSFQGVLAEETGQLKLTAVQPTETSGLDQLRAASAAFPEKSNTTPVKQSADQFDPHNLFEKPNKDEEEAFHSVTRNAMPMTPEQILRLKEMLAVTQRASSATAGTPPKPTLSTQLVNLAPGALPPVIRLQQGFVTSIVFVDETGADWPIEAYDLGNSRAFNIQWQRDTNVIMVQAINMYTYGNLAIKLQGLSTPVMLTLVPGQQVVDYRVDLRIQKYGPNAKAIVVSKTPTAASNRLLGILDGMTLKGATVLQVKGGDCKAWLLEDKMYLRTALTVLSPAWIGIMTSPDGTHAYEMEKSSTVLVSKYGKPIELKIEGL